MIKNIAFSGESVYGIKEYVVDTPKEISELATDGLQGSTAFVISTSDTYMLNGNKQWKLIRTNTSSGGDGGGTSPGDNPIIIQLEETVKQHTEDIIALKEKDKQLESAIEKKADLNQVYTKTEIDSLVSSVYRYKGTFNTFQDLLQAVALGVEKPTVGDVYNIRKTGGEDSSGNLIKAGDNVVYTKDSDWDVLSGVIDLTSYATKDDLSKKVDKIPGSRLMTEEEGKKLLNIKDGAEPNLIETIVLGGKKVDIKDKVVDIPIATLESMGVVKGAKEENKIDIMADGTMSVHSLNLNKLTQTKGEELILNGGASNLTRI